MNDEKRTLKEIQEQISALQKIENELLREEHLQHQEASRVHIGRCFRQLGGRYVVVTDIPQEEDRICGIPYNPNQFPGIALTDGKWPCSIIPFEETDVLFDIWEGNYAPAAVGKYTEITREEFLSMFDMRIQEFRERVYKILSIEHPAY